MTFAATLFAVTGLAQCLGISVTKLINDEIEV